MRGSGLGILRRGRSCFGGCRVDCNFDHCVGILVRSYFGCEGRFLRWRE